jgi:hypothetical protein
MEKCEECGKNLGFLEGYRHPTLGKKHHLCGPCFNQVSESVARWGEFVLANSFNLKTSEKRLNVNWKKFPSFSRIWNKKENVLAEKNY